VRGLAVLAALAAPTLLAQSPSACPRASPGPRALTLAIRVVPPRDPAGRPWRLDVVEITRDNRVIAVGVGLPPEGRWQRTGLTRGLYRLDLANGAGHPWLGRVVELDERTAPVLLRAPSVKVSGLLQLGVRPLRARAVFRDDAGNARIPLESAADGRFSGYLPWTEEGRYRGWAVEVQAASPPVNHRLEGVLVPAARGGEAWLDLVVPHTGVRGTVLAEDRAPQEGALVLCEGLEEGLGTTVAFSDARGVFDLTGLAAGAYRLSAEGPHGLSDPREVRVGPDDQEELELVLTRRKRLVSGLVRAGGEPVALAVVHFWMAPARSRGSALTDAQGRFELALPSGVDEIGLTVGARGYALKMTRVAASGPEPVVVELERAAGTLVLESLPGGADSVLLAHAGSVQSMDALAAWAAENGEEPRADRLVIPAVEPGRYSVCWARPRDREAVWAGKGGAGLCRTGQLAADGELSLSPPPD
jgi:carboxypeptidase family protein